MKRKINRWLSVILAVLMALGAFMLLDPAIISTSASNETDFGENIGGASKTANAEGWTFSIQYIYAYGEGDDRFTITSDSITWDASDNDYKSGLPKTITVQVNYSYNGDAYYAEGDLTISIPNLIWSLANNIENTAYKAQWNASVNTITFDNIDETTSAWVYSGQTSPGETQQNYTFTNIRALGGDENFDGSFQITYTLTPANETPEKFDDTCTHEYEKTLQATLTETASGDVVATSEELDFKYKREYIHPWQEVAYGIKKEAEKITSYDGLGENPGDYIWVRYNFTVTRNNNSSTYPWIICDPLYFTDVFPDGCVIYDGGVLQNIEDYDDNTVKTAVENLNWADYPNWNRAYFSYIVGYPKETYNQENGNLSITNHVDLYGQYGNKKSEEKLDDAEIPLNLGNFAFTYPPGDYFGIIKSGLTYNEIEYSGNSTAEKKLHYQSVINDDDYTNMIRWTITAIVNAGDYNGIYHTPVTAEIGDDLLYHTHEEDGTRYYAQTADSEYYFQNIVIPAWVNGNNAIIDSGKYTYDVFVRYANQDDYVRFNAEDEPYFNSDTSTTITFDKDNVVAWYIKIYDLTDNLKNLAITTDMYFRADEGDIPESGTIYNFDYLKAYDPDGTLLNAWSEDNYNTPLTRDEIAEFDETHHGAHIQRATANKSWVYFEMLDAQPYHQITKSNVGTLVQSGTDECFYGEFQVTNSMSVMYDRSATDHEFFEQLEDEDFFTEFTFYDLLPEGMVLISGKDEIKNSISASNSYNSSSELNFWTTQGEQAFANLDEASAFFREHADVIEITPNWNNTGRTRIKIHFKFDDFPLFCYGNPFGATSIGNHCGMVRFNYRYSIPYDSVLSYGKTYRNYAYLQVQDESTLYPQRIIEDNGSFPSEPSDITGDGRTDDKLIYDNADVEITAQVSTIQGITKFVLTDTIDDYKTGSARSSLGAQYSYKIRVRSGQGDITNVVIYDSIEEKIAIRGEFESAYGENAHWQGEFLGVDVSFAQSRTYEVRSRDESTVTETIHVRVWYSTKSDPDSLYDRETLEYSEDWHEYDEDTTNKSLVKSLAFEFLDQDGNQAILPADISTYVLVKMRAPTDEDPMLLAYNGSWSEWQALDDIYREPVKDITGIDSNIVRVTLNEMIDIEGTKTWIGDTEESRPDEITVILFRDGEEYARTTASAATDWKYSFGTLPKYHDDGETEYEYSVKEVYVEGYETEYKKPINGLRITFDDLYTYNSYDTIYIYYEREGRIEMLTTSYFGDNSGMVVDVPSDNFYIYLVASSFYGNRTHFSVVSVEPYDGAIVTGNAAVLPSAALIECAEVEDLKYNTGGDSTNKLWHYAYEIPSEDPAPGAFTIVNTDAHTAIQGTKTWAGDITEFPDSITVLLLRDGEAYRTQEVTPNADGEWKYKFEGLPKYDEDGVEYQYSVKEEAIDGYTPYYGTLAPALAITFSEQSETSGTSNNYVYIYYELDGVIYRLGKYGGRTTSNNIANTTVIVPSDHFWIYWHTNAANSYYGFSIDSIEYVTGEIDVSGTQVDALPDYELTELANGEYPESKHSPHESNVNMLWHYTEKMIVWSETPQVGLYDIINLYPMCELPGSGESGTPHLYAVSGCLLFFGVTGVLFLSKRKKTIDSLT